MTRAARCDASEAGRGHTFGEVVFEIGVADPPRGPLADPGTLAGLLARELLPALEAACAALDPADAVALAEIVIDLGDLPAAPDWATVQAELSARLHAALVAQTRPRAARPGGGPAIIATRAAAPERAGDTGARASAQAAEPAPPPGARAASEAPTAGEARGRPAGAAGARRGREAEAHEAAPPEAAEGTTSVAGRPGATAAASTVGPPKASAGALAGPGMASAAAWPSRPKSGAADADQSGDVTAPPPAPPEAGASDPVAGTGAGGAAHPPAGRAAQRETAAPGSSGTETAKAAPAAAGRAGVTPAAGSAGTGPVEAGAPGERDGGSRRYSAELAAHLVRRIAAAVVGHRRSRVGRHPGRVAEVRHGGTPRRPAGVRPCPPAGRRPRRRPAGDRPPSSRRDRGARRCPAGPGRRVARRLCRADWARSGTPDVRAASSGRTAPRSAARLLHRPDRSRHRSTFGCRSSQPAGSAAPRRRRAGCYLGACRRGRGHRFRRPPPSGSASAGDRRVRHARVSRGAGGSGRLELRRFPRRLRRWKRRGAAGPRDRRACAAGDRHTGGRPGRRGLARHRRGRWRRRPARAGPGEQVHRWGCRVRVGRAGGWPDDPDLGRHRRRCSPSTEAAGPGEQLHRWGCRVGVGRAGG